MPTFTLYCKTVKLWDRIKDILLDIPSYFYIQSVIAGTPEVSIGEESDPNWNGFPMPVNKGDIYVFDDDIPALALGGAYEMRASIRVREEDTDEVITLRIWHELLHAVGKPADDMIRLSSEWLTGTDRIVWYLCRLFGVSVDIPYWQTKFYRWLSA